MRHIEVKYQNGTHAFVDDYLLDSLIHTEQITHFYRPSERQWIKIGVDPIRREEGPHPGRERRRTGSAWRRWRRSTASNPPCVPRKR